MRPGERLSVRRYRNAGSGQTQLLTIGAFCTQASDVS